MPLFKKYLNFSDKINFCKLAIDLENGVNVPKLNQLFRLSCIAVLDWRQSSKESKNMSMFLNSYLFKSSCKVENEVKVTKIL